MTDFELRSPTAVRYLGTIGTPEMLREIVDKNECESDPLWVSDLVVVSHLSEKAIIRAVRALIARGEVDGALDLAVNDELGFD